MSALKQWMQKFVWVIVLIASMVASYSAISVWRQRMADSRLRPVATSAIFNPTHGTHLIAYVMAASDCGWSNHPSMLGAYKTIRTALKTFHSDKYAQITVVGVALDQDLSAGLKFLGSIGGGSPEGAFDQIVVGGSWLNDQIVRFVWREHAAEAGTPLIVLVERPIDAASYRETYKLAVEKDSVIAIKDGADTILTWIKDGTPLETRISMAR